PGHASGADPRDNNGSLSVVLAEPDTESDTKSEAKSNLNAITDHHAVANHQRHHYGRPTGRDFRPYRGVHIKLPHDERGRSGRNRLLHEQLSTAEPGGASRRPFSGVVCAVWVDGS